MRRWEIFEADIPPGGTKHPVVVFSPNSICENAGIDVINVLLCSSIKEGETLSESEVGLDSADGLERLTGCQCHMLWHVKKVRLVTLRGVVSELRRDVIRRKLREAFLL